MTILIHADGCPGVSDVIKNKTSSRTLPLIRLNLRRLCRKKARHTAICRRKSAAFCEMTLEKAFFTRGVSGCISGVVVLDVR